MEVKINQVVLHLLDPGASEPVLSDRAMDMDADLYEYYTATLERAFASDEVKNCRFLPDSAFAQEMAQNSDFIDLSRRIAGVIFEQMIQYQSIPAGDLAVVDFTADGVPFYGVLKLNYRPGYTHHTELLGNGRFSSMVPQRTLLPGPHRPCQRHRAPYREEVHAGRQEGLLAVHPGVRLHRGPAGKGQAEGRLRDRRGRCEGGLPRAGGAGRCAPI